MSHDYLTHYYFSLILYWSLTFEKYLMSYYHMRYIFCLSIIWAPPRLKSAAFECNLILVPRLVLLDFEKAAISAIKEVFPNCKVIGCYFHFIQALWKNIQNKGLTNEYRNDPYFKKWVFKLYF